MRLNRREDILQSKKKELDSYIGMANDAIQIVTDTVSSLENINSCIELRTQEIDEYQRGLEETKTGLENARKKNERVIKNFKALLGEE